MSRDARATPQPVPANQQMPRPVIVVARVLDDGRIGALVRFGVETSTDSNVDLVAFRRVEGQSRIDEVVTDYRQGIATPTARLQLS